MAAGAALGMKKFLAWLIGTFGRDVVIWCAEELPAAWRKHFTKCNVLILGPKQSGKTSLIYFLTTKKPYKVSKDKSHVTPNPTSGAAIINKRVAVGDGGYAKIPKDLPGDETFRHLWVDLIKSCEPKGIIYLLDGRLGEKPLRDAVMEMRRDVLDQAERNGQSLRVLYVFLNFADCWGKSQKAIRGKSRIVLNAIEKAVEGSEYQQEIHFGAVATQLSPDHDAWPEASKAIQQFGAELSEA